VEEMSLVVFLIASVQLPDEEEEVEVDEEEEMQDMALNLSQVFNLVLFDLSLKLEAQVLPLLDHRALLMGFMPILLVNSVEKGQTQTEKFSAVIVALINSAAHLFLCSVYTKHNMQNPTY
jgi:hypothetical protein